MSNEKTESSVNVVSEEEPGTSYDNLEEITLEVENTLLKCRKYILVNNSDYFRVMLEGNFKEKNQSTVKLKAVELKPLNIILQDIREGDYLKNIDEIDDLLKVLQTSVMLQFNKIEETCISLLTNVLNTSNCLKIWIVTEQLSLKPLYLKAKLLALDEFFDLKDSTEIGELTLEQLVSYVGSIYIKTDTEYTIFQTVMSWWKLNYAKYSEKSLNALLRILSCIDFQELNDSYFNDILLQPDISNNSEVVEILKGVSIVKMGKELDESYSNEVKEKVKLLLKTTGRKTPGGLCILANTLEKYELDCKLKSLCADDKIEIFGPSTIQSENNPEQTRKKRAVEVDRQKSCDLAILFYDERYPMFTKIFEVENHRCFCLDGFAIMGYKQQVFIYGGQFVIGRGEWNYNFWVWDSIIEKFEKRARFPYPRRHFDTCRIDDTLFICGGTGLFRILQDTVFWYDYKNDVWGEERPLPVNSDKQSKCCFFKETLFVFSMISRCGYFFRQGEPREWEEVRIELNTTFYSNNFVIFSYKDKLYFKGKMLIECTIEGDKMITTSQKPIADFDFDKIEVVLINNLVYTHYEYSDHLALECYNMDTGEKKFIFQDVLNSMVIETDKGEKYVVTNKMRIFSCHYYGLVEGNNLVNENFSIVD